MPVVCMRQFVVVGHDAPTTPDFSLDDLPGAGRLDLLARCVTSSLLQSHGIRESARIHLVLADEFRVTVDGRTIRGLHPDERSTAAQIRAALEQRTEAVGRMAVETSPGISLTRVGLAGTLDAVATEGTVCLLQETGTPAADLAPPADPVCLLSDHHDFTDGDRAVLKGFVDERVALGPEPLHADQAITVAHNWLDTDRYTRYGPQAGPGNDSDPAAGG
jgi:tRNA (pseudouridine54-N1)-methyltransferase